MQKKYLKNWFINGIDCRYNMSKTIIVTSAFFVYYNSEYIPTPCQLLLIFFIFFGKLHATMEGSVTLTPCGEWTFPVGQSRTVTPFVAREATQVAVNQHLFVRQLSFGYPAIFSPWPVTSPVFFFFFNSLGGPHIQKCNSRKSQRCQFIIFLCNASWYDLIGSPFAHDGG